MFSFFYYKDIELNFQILNDCICSYKTYSQECGILNQTVNIFPRVFLIMQQKTFGLA